MDEQGLEKLRAVRPDILVDSYVKLRDERRRISAIKNTLTVKMELLEIVMLNKMHELKVDQFSALKHTVFTTTNVTAVVKDREAFIDFVKTTGRFELMDARASKDAVVAYQKEAGDLPPGTHLNGRVRLNVRKGK